MSVALRVGVAGIHGHGRSHVDAVLRRAGAEGDVELTAVADPRPGADLPTETVSFSDAAEMMDAEPLDIVILSTPIPTHEELTLRALDRGIHVLLEKPPVPSIAAHETLTAAAARAERAIQVGFQSLGSAGVAATAEVAASGLLGEILHLSAVGLWCRSEEYWSRSAWAGRKAVDGRLVADGALTNPLAHAVATALAISGAAAPSDVARVDLDLYAANDIEVDDTSSFVLELADGSTIAGALAVTAPRRSEPYVLVRGTRGHAVSHYTLDLLTVSTDAAPLPRTYAFARTPLLADLVAHVRSGSPLAVPLERTGAFTRVLEEVVAAPRPKAIGSDRFSTADRNGETFRVVHDVEDWVERAAWAGKTFSAVGAPWT